MASVTQLLLETLYSGPLPDASPSNPDQYISNLAQEVFGDSAKNLSALCGKLDGKVQKLERHWWNKQGFGTPSLPLGWWTVDSYFTDQWSGNVSIPFHPPAASKLVRQRKNLVNLKGWLSQAGRLASLICKWENFVEKPSTFVSIPVGW